MKKEEVEQEFSLQEFADHFFKDRENVVRNTIAAMETVKRGSPWSHKRVEMMGKIDQYLKSLESDNG